MIKQFELENAAGISMKVINLGAAITNLCIPAKNGQSYDVVLGYDALESYLANPNYFGAVVGRYANRIANGKFTLNGQNIQLAQNSHANHLHGGAKGLHKQFWHPAEVTKNKIVFTHTSPDGYDNYPGNLHITLSYTLTEKNELIIDYQANTDKPTIINLTQHSYFNLAGHDSDNILNHLIRIHADKFTPIDQNMIPTGDINNTEGTALDLQEFTEIEQANKLDDPLLKHSNGLDHNYVLKNTFDKEIRLAAELLAPNTNILMRVLTDQPGVQLYTGNFIDGEITGKNNTTYKPYQGLCLETQHFPDSPNHSSFPSTELQPNQTFSSRTIYQFINN